MCAESRGRFVILAFHVEDDDRTFPRQQVRNDNADTLARARRRFDDHMLRSAKSQELAALAANDDSRWRSEPVATQFAFAGEACGSMKRRLPRPQRIKQHGEDDTPGEQTAGHRAHHMGIAAIIPEEARNFNRIIGRDRQAQHEPRDDAGSQQPHDDGERSANHPRQRPALRRRAGFQGHSRSPSR